MLLAAVVVAAQAASPSPLATIIDEVWEFRLREDRRPSMSPIDGETLSGADRINRDTLGRELRTPSAGCARRRSTSGSRSISFAAA